MVHTPLRFEPFLRPMVWGGRRLADRLGKPLPSGERFGESWEVSDHPLHYSRVAAGPFAGMTLRDLMRHHRDDLLGSAAAAHDVFPWLIKFLDISDWLSVQVHPNETMVRKLCPGEGSKTEAWFVLDAAPGSRVYAGLRPGIGKTEFRAALQAGTVAECLHSFEPRPGDCMFLPAGTVHAAGGGILIAEIQQTSDATFRLFDWNRRDTNGKSRPLHIDESLACIDWQRGPVTPIHVSEFNTTEAANIGCRRQSLVQCPYFNLEFLTGTEPFNCAGDGHIQVLIVLSGQGRLLAATGEEHLTAGQAWLLPASMPRASIQPQPGLCILSCT